MAELFTSASLFAIVLTLGAYLLFPVGFAVAAALLAVEGRHGVLFPKALRDFPVRQSCGVHFPHHFAFFRAPAEVDPGIRINFPDF